MREGYNYITNPKIYHYEQIECELGRSRAGVSQVLAGSLISRNSNFL